MGVQAKSAREKEVAFLRANPPKSKTKYADQNNDFTFNFLSLINHKSRKGFFVQPCLWELLLVKASTILKNKNLLGHYSRLDALHFKRRRFCWVTRYSLLLKLLLALKKIPFPPPAQLLDNLILSSPPGFLSQ